MTNKPMLSVELRAFLEGVVKLCAVHGPTYNELRALLDNPSECRCKRYGKDNPHWPCPVHAEPAAQHQGEVERLRAELRSAPLREALLEQVKGERDRMIERTIELSAQVDDRDSVLREVADLDPRGEFLGWQLDGKIDAILSTSAEPKPRGEQVGMLLIDELFDNREVGDVDVQLDKEVCGRLAQSHPGQSLAIYVELPAPVAVVMPNVDELAKIIRKVDGSHTLGAGSLAEAILEEVARLNGVKP